VLAFRPRPRYQTSPEGLSALSGAIRRAAEIYRPRPQLSLSQWSDEYAFIPPEAGATPGKFHTDFAEYQRGIMDAITDRGVETIVMMMGAQTGKSQIQNNAIGFYTHWEPSPMLMVQASLGEAEKYSKNRIAKMIRSTPVLRKLYPPPRARDSGNTLLNKEFPGGVLILAGANAPAGLASMPIRVLLPDEVDRYDESAGTEGDPVDLATKRTTTFWNRKIILASTPGIKNLSRIEKAYDSSDKRRYYVPCPHCGTYQVLEFPRLKWKTESLGEGLRPRVIDWWYVCGEGCIIQEHEKHEMIRRGEWRATALSHDGKTAGFHINALYSPVLEWIKLIQEWLDTKGSLERKKTFINTRLAETWEIRGTGADLHELEKRKETYTDLLPPGVLFLTAGVDTQDNRLECSVIGWGLDDERWVIDHRVFPGDPSLPETDAQSPWAALREYLLEPWDHALGVSMHVSCVLVDSGGHHTERVYDFTRKHELRRWYAIVGRPGIGKPLASSGNRVGPFKTLLYTVGVDTAKEDIFTSFRVGEIGAGYCHFSEGLPSEYFRQVTAEKLVKTTREFVTTMQWVKTSERNEALDCFVYARAAVAVLRPNFRKIKRNLDRHITTEQLRQNPPVEQVPLGAPAPKPTPKPEPVPAPETKPAAAPAKLADPVDNGRPRPANYPRPRKPAGFISGWRS
jgi:phage terminase large subunit GpA-like protein